MSRDIKNVDTVLRALRHLRERGTEFALLPTSVLLKVGTRRVRGMGIFARVPGGALESPMVAVYNRMIADLEGLPHVASTYHLREVARWSIPSRDFFEIASAGADLPGADPALRKLLLVACGLQEVPLDERPFVKKSAMK